jgi:hypothetical protein
MASSKYNNRKITFNGIIFDSVGEANRYKQLLLLEKANRISDLKTQVKITLLDSFKLDKATIRGISYYADFQYVEGGKTIIEDYKGFKTDVYKLKRKLLLDKIKDDPNMIFIET